MVPKASLIAIPESGAWSSVSTQVPAGLLNL